MKRDSTTKVSKPASLAATTAVVDDQPKVTTGVETAPTTTAEAILPDPALATDEGPVIPPITNTPAPEPAAVLPAAAPAVTETARVVPAVGLDAPEGVTTETTVVTPVAQPTAEPILEGTTTLRDTARSEDYARSGAPRVKAAMDTVVAAALTEIIGTGPKVAVLCHVEGGRRRGGVRWVQGETIVDAKALTEAQWSQIAADPRFTVRVQDED